ncbi:MAG TPA: beta-ketoacyl synthase N-terminal-like domain-containing protein [Candidatus Acidoferrum sp.]|nr:beta-ketoacyl synthase N-terminal-like domain-containing protein [Candidatus Acidoferrum sp.]
MKPPIRLAGIGVVRPSYDGGQPDGRTGQRLSQALSASRQGGLPVRLFHPLEEVACLAAYEALSQAGIAVPSRGEGIGVAIGVDEGIDAIKARYYREVVTDGPLGASPLAFPFTTPNTIAARISILFGLRGESLTVCGGSLSGAQAIGLAMDALREGRSEAVLAGGATSVEQEFLDALGRAGQMDDGQPRCGAGFLLLGAEAPAAESGGRAELIGYGAGFGPDEITDAVQACLEDAGLSPSHVESVRVAWLHDSPALARCLHRVVADAPIHRSPSADLYSAAFPMAVAEAARQAATGTPGSVLVVGRDCAAGASAALVRGRGHA